MKKAIILALVVLAACQSNPNENGGDKPSLHSELVELELGSNVVYGVIIRDSSAVTDQRGYSIKLSLNEKVWYDTLYLELTAKQAVQGEVFFSEAIVDDMGGAQYEVSPFEI